jgi:hypothetical protein
VRNRKFKRDEIWRKANYRLSKQPSSGRTPRRCPGRNDFSTSLSKRGKIARLCTERAMRLWLFEE